MSVQSVIFALNGTNHALTYNEASGKWEATVTAPGTTSYGETDHVLLASVKAVDDAGNETTVDATHETLGDSLKLRVLEKVAPTITLVSPTAGAYVTANNPNIVFKLKDEDTGAGASGLDLSKLKITLDDNEITSGWTSETDEDGFTVITLPTTGLADGDHTYTIEVEDNDGNKATSAATTFTVDTVDPELNLTTPADGLVTNADKITVEGTTNDDTSTPVKVTINGEEVTVTDGAFSKDVDLEEGDNTITVVATDAAGRTTTITRTVVKNTSAPVITAVELVPNPVDAGATYIVKATVSDE